LFTAANLNSTGNAGSIILNTDRLDLSGGSVISSGTLGAGRGGDVNIFANTVNLSEGGGIFTGTFGATGHGGDIVITARDTVTVSGTYSGPTGDFPSSLFSSAYAGTGDAGNITVTAPHLILADGGMIDATSELTSGGNITLNVDHLKLLDGSAISSTVEGDATTIGGNVTINSVNVAALNGSNVTAKANQGRGGNIILNADVFLHNAASINEVLDASSQVEGNDGTVQNNAPTTDISGSLVALNTSYLDAAGQLNPRCGTGDPDERSRFTVQGRGALPPEPDQPATARVTDCRSEPPTLVQATSLAPIMNDTSATPTPAFGDR
jgi:large exoprotein involved in heme utilization and adhesion